MSSYKKFLFMVLPGPKSSFHGIPIHEIALCGILVHEILMRSLFVEFLFMKVQHFHVFLKRKRGKFDFIVYCVAVMYGTSNSS